MGWETTENKHFVQKTQSNRLHHPIIYILYRLGHHHHSSSCWDRQELDGVVLTFSKKGKGTPIPHKKPGITPSPPFIEHDQQQLHPHLSQVIPSFLLFLSHTLLNRDSCVCLSPSYYQSSTCWSTVAFSSHGLQRFSFSTHTLASFLHGIFTSPFSSSRIMS